jgi:hypothetical protein
VKRIIETVLYGVMRGDEDWQEQLLSTTPAMFSRVKIVAAKDGFHRFRVASIDLSKPPDFTRTLARARARKGNV